MATALRRQAGSGPNGLEERIQASKNNEFRGLQLLTWMLGLGKGKRAMTVAMIKSCSSVSMMVAGVVFSFLAPLPAFGADLPIIPQATLVCDPALMSQGQVCCQPMRPGQTAPILVSAGGICPAGSVSVRDTAPAGLDSDDGPGVSVSPG